MRRPAAVRLLRCPPSLTWLLLALTGCTLPVPCAQREVLVGYAETDDVAHRARRVTFGLDLSVFGPSPGLTLGFRDTTWLAAAACPAGATAGAAACATVGAAGETSRATAGAADASVWCASAPPRDGYRFPLGWQWSDGPTRRVLGWVLAAPPDLADADAAVVFVRHAWAGLAAAWGPYEQALQLGLGASTLLAVPRHADGAWLIDFRSSAPSSARLRSVDLQGGSP